MEQKHIDAFSFQNDLFNVPNSRVTEWIHVFFSLGQIRSVSYPAWDSWWELCYYQYAWKVINTNWCIHPIVNKFKGFPLYLLSVKNIIFITKLLLKYVRTLTMVFKTSNSYGTFKEIFFFPVSKALEQGRVIFLTFHMLFNWPLPDFLGVLIKYHNFGNKSCLMNK